MSSTRLHMQLEQGSLVQQPKNKGCFGIKLCLTYKRNEKPNCDDRNIFNTAQRFPNHWQDIILQATCWDSNSVLVYICKGVQHTSMLEKICAGATDTTQVLCSRCEQGKQLGWTCSGTPSCSRRSMHPLLASLSETLLLFGVWLGV